MISYYPQYPTTPTYARGPSGSLQCPPGTRPQPMYPGRSNSPVRCLVTNAMEHAEWVVQDTEPVPTADIGPIGSDLQGRATLPKRSTALPTALLLLGLFATLGVLAFGVRR